MLLAVIAAAVLAFVIVLMLLAWAAMSEYSQLQRIGFDSSAQPFPLSVAEAFDPEHVVLWSTQIPALAMIRAAGGRGLRYDRLLRAYQNGARRYPELYEGSSFAQWLFLLQRAELICMLSRRVRITPLGRSFLDYCVQDAQVRSA